MQPRNIFDGLVTVYSTCRDCGEVMLVTGHSDTVHPTCEPQPTQLEKWEQSWLEIASSADYDKLAPQLRNKLDALEFKMMAEADKGRETALHNAAMTYAEWGWPIFPLAKRSKAPAIPKKQGGNGVLDATADTTRVCKYWSKHPDHNIGLATGFAFDVIDVDPKNGGVESFSRLLDEGAIPEVHAVVATAGNDDPFKPCGLHLYVAATGKGNYANLRPGIDYRGKGGYVVAPPSTLGSQVRSWSFTVQPSPIIKRGNG